MGDPGLGQPDHWGPLARQPQAEVHIFVVEGKGRIKTGRWVMGGGLEDQAAAAQPIHAQRLLSVGAADVQPMGTEAQAGGEPAPAGFQAPAAVLHRGSHQAAGIACDQPIHQVLQLISLGKGRIWVQEPHPPPPSLGLQPGQGPIAARSKAIPFLSPEHLHGETWPALGLQQPRLHRARAGAVVYHDPMGRNQVLMGEIPGQSWQHATTVVGHRDDGQRSPLGGGWGCWRGGAGHGGLGIGSGQ